MTTITTKLFWLFFLTLFTTTTADTSEDLTTTNTAPTISGREFDKIFYRIIFDRYLRHLDAKLSNNEIVSDKEIAFLIGIADILLALEEKEVNHGGEEHNSDHNYSSTKRKGCWGFLLFIIICFGF